LLQEVPLIAQALFVLLLFAGNARALRVAANLERASPAFAGENVMLCTQ
jgi:hypothetical protein